MVISEKKIDAMTDITKNDPCEGEEGGAVALKLKYTYDSRPI